MKILVTGSSGQLGQELKLVLLKSDELEIVYFQRGDMPLDIPHEIFKTLNKVSPDIIIHAGAYTAVDRAEEELDLLDKVNHISTKEIAQYCADKNCRLIFISTDYVFDGNSASPLHENDDTRPINAYGYSKLKAEGEVNRILPSAIIIRTSWVYSEYGNNFVKTMIRLMSEKTTISVVDDQTGSPTYAADLALAIKAIIEYPEWIPGTFHYSNEGQTTWYHFAKQIKAICKFECEVLPISSSQFKTLADRPKFSLLNKEKIKKTFGLKIPNWEDSLQKMLTRPSISKLAP